jgi:hypothetical protein
MADRAISAEIESEGQKGEKPHSRPDERPQRQMT